MKLMSFTAPVLIVSFTVAAVWGLGMLAVRSSAVSTQTSIELLRMNLRVAALHEALLQHSRTALAAQVQTLQPPGAVPPAAAGRAARKEKVSKLSGPVADPVAEAAAGLTARPWPETAEP